jgi:hypothetical protein
MPDNDAGTRTVPRGVKVPGQNDAGASEGDVGLRHGGLRFGG